MRETERTDTSVTIEFDRPDSDGGKEIDYYVLTVDKLNRDTNMLEIFKEENLVQRKYTVKGLEYDSVYNIKVSAVNSVGESLSSPTLFIHTNNRPNLLMNDISVPLETT